MWSKTLLGLSTLLAKAVLTQISLNVILCVAFISIPIRQHEQTRSTVRYVGLFDDNIEPEEGKRLWNTARLYQFDEDTGKEVNGLLEPSSDVFTSTTWCEMVKHIEAYPRLDDSQVLLVAEKTKCHPIDADLALCASKGDTMEAMVAIGLAQRSQLNASVMLPSKEEVEGKVDWDEELRKLNKEKAGEVGRSLGLDGEESRKEAKKRKLFRDAAKSALSESDPNQQWLPGKSNPKPVDDEPWFTG